MAFHRRMRVFLRSVPMMRCYSGALARRVREGSETYRKRALAAGRLMPRPEHRRSNTLFGHYFSWGLIDTL